MTDPITRIHPVIIIGSGPAGYTAAIYTARADLKPILFQGIQPGGQLTITTEVENYPGFAEPIQGPWLMDQMAEQAKRLNTTLIPERVISIDCSQRPFKVETHNSNYYAQSIILATGAQARWLNVPGETELKGFGISACATCDGPFFKNKEVLVIGGGNTAVEEALYLAQLCSKVTLVHRRDELRADKTLQKRLFGHPKIEVLWNHEVLRFDGLMGFPRKLQEVHLQSKIDQSITISHVEGCFIAIGHDPDTAFLKGQLELLPSGYLAVASHSTQTSVPGIFAAGDVMDPQFRQAVTAAGFGCMAALEAEKYLVHHPHLNNY